MVIVLQRPATYAVNAEPRFASEQGKVGTLKRQFING